MFYCMSIFKHGRPKPHLAEQQQKQVSVIGFNKLTFKKRFMVSMGSEQHEKVA